MIRKSIPLFIQLIVSLTLMFSQTVFAKKFFTSSASEITAALSQVQPGDTIVMRNGTWNDQKIIFQKNGTSENKIYLVAETPGKVLLSGQSYLRIAGNYLVVDGLRFENGYYLGAVIEFRNGSSLLSNYCRLTNTSIIDYNPPGSDSTKWVSLYGRFNRVDHCYFKGKKNNGTTMVVWLPDTASYRKNYAPNYHLIDSNYFAMRPPIVEDNGGETIRIGDSGTSMEDSYTTVEYNYFEECNGETEIISNKSCENIYRYNTFKDCQGILTLRHGNRCTVEGNFFFCGNKPNSGGIRVIGEDHKVFNNYVADSYGTSLKSAITVMNGIPNSKLSGYFQVKRAVIAFNTVVNSRVSLNLGAGKSSTNSLPPLDCVIANNIFYSNQPPLVTFTDQPININWAGNIFYGAAIGMTLPQGNLNLNPLLSKEPDGIFRIQQGSPAIDASDANYNFVNTDIDGQSRTATSDIGADEYSSDKVIRKPMGPENTGPSFMRTATGISGEDENIPSGFVLYQNYPNPFNPETKIKFSIPFFKSTGVETLHATSLRTVLKIYDALGREIATLVNAQKSPGNYEATFNGNHLPSGIYFCRLNAGEYSASIKMNLIK